MCYYAYMESGNIVIAFRGKERTLKDKINKVDKESNEQAIEEVSKNLILLLDWVSENKFDVVVATGRSSFLIANLLKRFGIDVERIETEQQKRYNDTETFRPYGGKNIAVVDELIGSGAKAKQILENLGRQGFKKYGFGSLSDPSDVSSGSETSQHFINECFYDNPELGRHLFIPNRPDPSNKTYTYISDMETIAKFADKNDEAKETILKHIDLIVSSTKSKLESSK